MPTAAPPTSTAADLTSWMPSDLVQSMGLGPAFAVHFSAPAVPSQPGVPEAAAQEEAVEAETSLTAARAAEQLASVRAAAAAELASVRQEAHAEAARAADQMTNRVARAARIVCHGGA